jgi:ParB family transcriptional regulator, chromosome partitioning protein
MSKNRNLMSGIADRVIKAPDEFADGNAHPGRRPEPLATNLGGVTNPRAPGQPDSKIQKTAIQRHILVDPAVCRPWSHHNRVYELLNEDRCADLIAGFRSVGRQQRPAIVRPLIGDARSDGLGGEHDFEIISGARRHWTVSWLRAHNEVNAESEPFLFLLVVRDDLSDADAFELSDAENRGQKDISDYERAKEYLWALENLYEGNISRMADAIQMDRSNLTRLVALTEMPDTVVRAYPSILDIRLHHWRELGPFFSSKEKAKQEAVERVLACAKSIVNARATHSGTVPTDGAQTAALLIAALKKKTRGGDRTQILETVTAKATGKVMLTIKRTTRGMTFDFPRASGATKDEVINALRRVIDEHFEAGESVTS